MVSYAPPGESTRVVNRLYLDIDPFDGNGKPGNAWQLFSEYTDVAGVGTGQYATLVNRGGWLTTVRSDGISRLDFLLVGVREIAPRGATPNDHLSNPSRNVAFRPSRNVRFSAVEATRLAGPRAAHLRQEPGRLPIRGR